MVRHSSGVMFASLLLLASIASAEQGEPKPSKPGSFSERTGKNREAAVEERRGTKESEEAVARGLKWLARQQSPDGKWRLNDQNLPAKDRGTETNEVAATAFGLLPFVGAGYTHKPGKLNPYHKVVDKGLKVLLRSQDPKTGAVTGGGNMYVHGRATIALCEAYGMTKDPAHKKPAQFAINLIVNAQHDAGGWRYSPTKMPGDTSVFAWQIAALKTAQTGA
jgi:hypothetical protein